MTPVQRERCERAIAFGRSFVPPRDSRVDMCVWGIKGEHGGCGTTACYAGWLSLDPWFNEQGLTSRWRGIALVMFPTGDGGKDDNRGTDEIYEALADFFGLRAREAEKVFAPTPIHRLVAAADRFAEVLGHYEPAA